MMSGYLARLLASTASVALMMTAGPAFAQSPQAPTVAAGSIAVSRQGATTVVTQGTERGIIDWRSFSIGPQEAVRFDQPGRSSVTLNRVTGAELSRIDGSLSANGQVWLSNPNGVMIGPGGQVNVGGLLATTGRIDSQDFLRSGRASIDRIDRDAAIANAGTINIADGGYAALAAASIRNDGVIAARSGSVAFGSGKAMTVDFSGDRLIQFQVTQPLDQAPAGSDALIASAGSIVAEGGTVLMSARAAKGVMDNVVNLSGHVISNSVRVDGGTVTFGDGGTVQVSAKIDASNRDGVGGRVEVLGEKVGLMDGAKIDATGVAGGGTVLVGGDWQGKGAGQNATVAYVAPTAAIDVSAIQRGDGGKAVVWADDTTRFNGTITAQGGVAGGDGGKVETSGKRALAVGASASVTAGARAAGGKSGSWLLDPTDVTIVAGGGVEVSIPFTPSGGSTTINASVIAAALTTSDVTVTTTSAFGGNGDIVFASGTINHTGPAPQTLTFAAERNITMQAGTQISSAGQPLSVFFTARSAGAAQGAIKIDGSISTQGGSITLGGPSSGAAVGGANSFTVGVLINAGGLTSDGGDIVIRGDGAAGATGVEIKANISANTSNAARDGVITIIGNALPGGSGGHGVKVLNASITTDGPSTAANAGSIHIVGKSSSTSGNSSGILLDGATISTNSTSVANGAGMITLDGTRGFGGSSSNIAIVNASSVSTNNGAMSILGTAAQSGAATNDNNGVAIAGNSTITTASGTVSLSGSGGAIGSNNVGLVIGDGSAASILATASGGEITVIGKPGAGSTGVSFDSAALSTVDRPLTLQSDLFQVVSASSFTAGGGPAGRVNVRPDTASLDVAVDGVTNPGTLGFLGLTSKMVTGFLEIGRPAMTGTITVSGSVVLNQGLGLVTGTGDIVVTGDVNSSTAGSYTFAAMTSGGSISLDGDVGHSGELNNIVIGGPLQIAAGKTLATAAGGTQSYSGAIVLTGDNIGGGGATFRTGGAGGRIVFEGPIGSSSTAAKAPLIIDGDGTGDVSFNGIVGGTPLYSLSAGSIGSLTVKQSITTAFSQIYNAPVVADSQSASATSFTSNSGSIAFNSDLQGPSDVVISSSGETTFGDHVGTNTALASLTVNGPTRFVGLGDEVITVGSQSYSGAVTLANTAGYDMYLSTTNGSVIAFGGTVNGDGTGTQAIKSLGGSTLSFAGAVGGMVGGELNFIEADGPAVIGANVTTTGNQNYAGKVTVTGPVTITSFSGDVAFADTIVSPPGSPQALTVKALNGDVAFNAIVGDGTSMASVDVQALGDIIIPAGSQLGHIKIATQGNAVVGDAGASLVIDGVTVGGSNTFALISTGTTITQSGPIRAPYMELDAASAAVTLDSGGNAILNFAGSANSLVLTNGSDFGLIIGSVGQSTGLNVLGALTLTQGGGLNLTISDPLSAASASLSAGGQINATGAITLSNPPLTIAANGGTIADLTIGGTPLPGSFNLVTVTSGSVTIGATTKSAPEPENPAPQTTTPTVASGPSQPSVASVPVIPSQPSVATVASVPSIATVASSGSVASQPNFVTIVDAPSGDGAPSFDTGVLILIGSAGGTGVLNQIITPQLSFDSPLPTPTPPVVAPVFANPASIAAVPSGALMPPAPPVVAGTGAALTSTPTVKVDAADTGGASGQVIATFGGGGGPSGIVIPGLVTFDGYRRTGREMPQEPPLAQLPSLMNEEYLLD